MRGIGILILVVLFFWLCWPAISRWLKRKAMEKAENYMRQAMGMPPREKSRRKDSYRNGGENRRGGEYRHNPYAESGRKGNTHEPCTVIMRQYAEDIEFVEIKDYSSETVKKTVISTESFRESQVSEAEWTEIKEPR